MEIYGIIKIIFKNIWIESNNYLLLRILLDPFHSSSIIQVPTVSAVNYFINVGIGWTRSS